MIASHPQRLKYSQIRATTAGDITDVKVQRTRLIRLKSHEKGPRASPRHDTSGVKRTDKDNLKYTRLERTRDILACEGPILQSETFVFQFNSIHNKFAISEQRL